MMLSFVPPPQPDHTLPGLEAEWHRDLIEFLHYDLFRILAILLVGFLLARIIRFIFDRVRKVTERNASHKHASQVRTLASILRATSYSVLIFLLLLKTLSVFHINLTPLLASAGVVGVGIGLGAQSLFKDIINGIFILVEDQYNVGEVVRLAGLQGTVEDLSLRATRLRDGDGTLYIIPNSQVATVSNLSRDFSLASLPVSVDASADPDHVMAVLLAMATEVRNDPRFTDLVVSDPQVPGIDKINGREVIYLVNLRVRANQRDPILREMRRRLIQVFEQESIAHGTSASTLILQQPADPTAPPRPPAIGV